MDSLDVEILRDLALRRVSARELARKNGVTRNTIHNRLKRLTQKGILKITGLIDPATIPGHSVALIGFKTDPKKIKKTLREIKVLRGVTYAAHVRGSLDILAVVLFNEERTYHDFVDREIPKIREPVFMETFFVEAAGNYRTPYTL